MNIKEMRSQTGFSQSKFADMFEIPVATLKDWEQGRRTPPVYVTNMIKTILEFKGLVADEEYIRACENRKKSVERTMAIILTATKGPDENFMKVLEEYISGKISLEDIEKRVDCLGKAISDALINFPETDILPEDSNNINEEYQIAKSDYEAFKEKYSVKK